jgi:purine-binding chemotaxis protein CheW
MMMSSLTSTQRQFITFWVDEYLLGLDILDIREINSHMSTTFVPLAPPAVRGLINLRGQIVTIMDLRFLFGLGHTTLTEETQNIVLKSLADENGHGDGGNDRVGLLVDRIGDIITVEENDLEPPPANIGELDGYYFSQVVKLPQGVASILNPSHLLEPQQEQPTGKAA